MTMMMQDNNFTALKDKLLSIDFIDINSNETERNFDFLLNQTITYADLTISNNDDTEKQREKFHLTIKARQKYETETHFVRYLKVGNTNTHETYNCIDSHKGRELKWELKDSYNIKSYDIYQLKSLLDRLEEICILSNTLLEYFKSDCQNLRDGKVWDDKQFNVERWNEFMNYFSNGESHKSITYKHSRASVIYNFGRWIHSTDVLLKDIHKLFFQRKEVLALIIKELEPAAASVEAKKDDAPAPEANNQGDDIFDFDKEIETLMKSENKFHKGLPMHFVINHFKVFCEKKNKDNDFYLTKESFISFIKRGFLNDDTQPIQEINFGTNGKGFVVLKFYECYSKAVGTYSHSREKKFFVNLILICFGNLGDYKSIYELLKPNKTKQK